MADRYASHGVSSGDEMDIIDSYDDEQSLSAVIPGPREFSSDDDEDMEYRAELVREMDGAESLNSLPSLTDGRRLNVITNSSLDLLPGSAIDSTSSLESATGDGSEEAQLQQQPLINASSEESRQRGAAQFVKSEVDESGNVTTKVVRKSIKDFKFGKELGEGSYSTVVLATDTSTQKQYAIKILDKKHIIREKKVKYVNIEKNALNRMGKRDGIIHLFYTFQDQASLYFVLDYAPNGELLTLIKRFGTMNEDSVRYYAAQILDAVKYMHGNGIIHRDLKPENILIDPNYRVQITDFGTAKMLDLKDDGSYPQDTRATSFVGTAEYVSPELLNDKYCGKASDIWAFGCIVYQMIAGKPPFKAANEYLTFQKVCKVQFAFSAGFPMVIRDLVRRILVLKPRDRITLKGIQQHFFFQSINWEDHDSIWNTKPPELGPYKISAKSMLPVPELANKPFPNASTVSLKPPSRGPASRSASSNSIAGSPLPLANSSPTLPLHKQDSSSSSSASTLTQRSVAVQNSPQAPKPKKKTAKAASTAAAAALMKKPTEIMRPSAPSSAETTSSTTAVQPKQTRSSAEYIPGTNILRPILNTRLTTQSTSSNSRSNSNLTVATKPKKPAPSSGSNLGSKPAEVAPMSVLDLAWVAYFKNPNERVLKVGNVKAIRYTTDQFEKRYRGQLAESPLGYRSRENSNSSTTSLLTQVAHGSGTGFRRPSGTSSSLTNYVSTIAEDEDDDAFSFTGSKENEAEKEETAKEEFHDKATHKLKRFFGASVQHLTAPQETFVAKHRTMLITTLGRAMMFIQNHEKGKQKYELTAEVDLTNTHVRFKEVIGDRRSKNLMITGVFAIESLKTTFAFEVDKQEVSAWTNALAKARMMEQERKQRAASPVLNNGETAMLAAAMAVNSNPTSPRLEGKPEDGLIDLQITPLSPIFRDESLNNLFGQTEQPDKSPRLSERSPRNSTDLEPKQRQRHRRPPTSSTATNGGRSGGNGSNFPSTMREVSDSSARRPEDSAETRRVISYNSPMISAAINKAIQGSENTQSAPPVERRSSYTRSNDPGRSYTPPGDSSKSGVPRMVTSMNSRFLARTNRRKK